MYFYKYPHILFIIYNYTFFITSFNSILIIKVTSKSVILIINYKIGLINLKNLTYKVST